MTKYLLLILSLLFGATAWAQQGVQKNISLSKQVPLNSGLTDVWGYADAQGNEYALVGLNIGVFLSIAPFYQAILLVCEI